MNIIHIVPHVGNEASGPSYSAVRLAQSIATIGDQVLLLTVKDGYVPPLNNCQHRVFPKARFPSMLWRSPKLCEELLKESKAADILHSHSLWVMPNVYPGWIAKKTSKPLVVSPRGTLTKWALSRSAIRKKIFWHSLQKQVLKGAACLHATSEEEYFDIRRIGLMQPVCIIPNGIDIPDILPKEEMPSDTLSDRRTLLYLGRLHQVKGIDLLIHAWSKIAKDRTDWQLRIVGPVNERYTKELKNLVSTLNVPRVEFAGAVFGRAKQLEYQRADLYILPTHSENFGMTVAEALANSTPVITTKNAPWRGLVQHGCGWWIDLTLEQLTFTLLEATDIDSGSLSDMGSIGRRWVSEKYNWANIGKQMHDVYDWLLTNGSRPDCVKVD